MIRLESEIEKGLWREAALSAIKTVEGASSSEDKEVLKFAIVVADSLVLEYRKRK